jgi:hypothetical protein
MDETWSYHYGPEKKQQSKDWRHSRSAHQPQKIPSAKFGLKSSQLEFL